ncbi:hypothetical protein VTJ04DRAFT_10127 [Mycothermus thermophilus]|uniref:uncharacterized protein n=1 Tax=Humicola insolens TaxID=85995 RepID=UPI003743D1EA
MEDSLHSDVALDAISFLDRGYRITTVAQITQGPTLKSLVADFINLVVPNTILRLYHQHYKELPMSVDFIAFHVYADLYTALFRQPLLEYEAFMEPDGKYGQPTLHVGELFLATACHPDPLRKVAEEIWKATRPFTDEVPKILGSSQLPADHHEQSPGPVKPSHTSGLHQEVPSQMHPAVVPRSRITLPISAQLGWRDEGCDSAEMDPYTAIVLGLKPEPCKLCGKLHIGSGAIEQNKRSMENKPTITAPNNTSELTGMTVDPVDPPPKLKPQGPVAEFLEILCNIMDETDGEGEEDKRWSSGLVWMLMMRLYEAFFQGDIVREGHPLWHWYVAGEEKIVEMHGGWE